jgi:hypothetical protein
MRQFITRFAALLFLLGLVSVSSSPSARADATSTETGSTISVGAASTTDSAPSAPSSSTSDSSPTSGPAAFVPNCTTTVLALNNQVDGPPPGATTPGSWYSITCTTADGGNTTTNPWISSAPGAPPAAAPAVDPYALALQAENSLNLPSPTIEFNPPANAVVNLPTWLWIEPALWHPYVVSATVGAVTATATATPTSVVWNLGDGSSLTCEGPGSAYRTDLPSAAQQTSCSHTYQTTSLGQPSPDGDPNDGAFLIAATVDWQVAWTAQGAPGGGNLPPLSTTAAANLRVEQVESVNS